MRVRQIRFGISLPALTIANVPEPGGLLLLGIGTLGMVGYGCVVRTRSQRIGS